MRFLILFFLALSIAFPGWIEAPVGSNKGYVRLKADSSTSVLTTIDYGHHEIHAGSHYFVQGVDYDFDKGDSLVFSTCVPDDGTKDIHMLFEISSSGICSVLVTESDSTSGGTLITPKNNNRNSSKTSILTLRFQPTIQSIGDTLLQAGWGASGQGNNPGFGGASARDDEIILKNDTCTTWWFRSGTDNSTITYRGSWYEHTPITDIRRGYNW